MPQRELSLADAMAIAVLRGDRAAAYALCDLLLEEKDGGRGKIAEAARELQQVLPPLGIDFYRSEEFQALCKRFGIFWDLRTLDITILIPSEGTVKITQRYLASDKE